MSTTNKPTKLWVQQLIMITQSIVAIYIAIFCAAVFYLHHGENWLVPTIILGILFTFVVVVSVQRLITRLPMAVLMIAAPTVPLIILLLAITLLPILQLL